MDLLQKISRRSTMILLPLAAVTALVEWWRLPAGVLIGGSLALLNIRGLAWGVMGLIGAERPLGKMVFFSQFRLVMLFAVMALFVYLRIVNIFGLLAGFSVVFGVVLVEGYLYAKADKPDEPDT